MNPQTGAFKGAFRSRYFVRTVFRDLNGRMRLSGARGQVKTA
jgi:hypothetical protein